MLTTLKVFLSQTEWTQLFFHSYKVLCDLWLPHQPHCLLHISEGRFLCPLWAHWSFWHSQSHSVLRVMVLLCQCQKESHSRVMTSPIFHLCICSNVFSSENTSLLNVTITNPHARLPALSTYFHLFFFIELIYLLLYFLISNTMLSFKIIMYYIMQFI